MTGEGRREILVAEPAAAGERLDRFIVRRLGDVSRKAVKRALDGGRIFVDGRSERRAGLLLAGGDRVILTLDLPAPPRMAPALPILYRDEALLAVDKPAGLPVHPTGDGGPNALEGLVSLLHSRESEERPILLHRLDVETTGVLLFALHAAANRALAGQFAGREIDKTYLALVAGAPPPFFRAENRLRSGKRGRTVIVTKGGQLAVSEFRTLGRGDGFSLVEASPHTGRTHQIRVHLAGEGFPLLGDTLYGGPVALPLGGERVAVPRHLLHAARLRFRHPTTGVGCTIEASPPADFLPYLERISGTPSIR